MTDSDRAEERETAEQAIAENCGSAISANAENKEKAGLPESREVEKLRAELESVRVTAAIRLALMRAEARDAEYVEYKLREELAARGERAELDGSGGIRNWEALLEEMKRRLPQQFGARAEEARAVPTPLPKRDTSAPMSRAEFLKKPYTERAALMAQSPDAYKCIMDG